MYYIMRYYIMRSDYYVMRKMYYIMRKSYYVMHKLLRYAKNVLRYAAIITLCAVITLCGVTVARRRPSNGCSLCDYILWVSMRCSFVTERMFLTDCFLNVV